MRSLAAVGLLLCLSGPAAAQAAPDPTALKAAREMVAITDIRGQMRAIGPRLAEAVNTQVRQMFAGNAVPEDLQARMSEALKAHIGSIETVYTPELLDRFALIYARNFTPDELQRLTSLMRDPVMVKLRDKTPDMTAELLPMMMEAMKPRQDQLRAAIMKIVTDWIAEHPNDKAKLRSPSAS